MDTHQPQAQLSDETLAALVAGRDVAAFTLLYDRYAPSVYAFAAHTLGGADAEEVVQDVFLRLWHKAEQFDPARGSFSAWFMGTARHRILDDLRRRSKQRALLMAEEIDRLLANTPDPAIDLEASALVRERNDGVRLALQQLPAEQRIAVLLAYFAGLTQSAISEHLGWPLGTVKKRIRLGLQKLQAALTGEETVVGIKGNQEDIRMT